MNLNIFVSVDDEKDSICGWNCAFLNIDECLLFNEDLSETILPDGFVWQDDTEPTRDRCKRCLNFNIPSHIMD